MTAPIDDGADASETIMIMEKFLSMGLRNRVDLIGRPDTSLQIVEGIS